MKSTAIGIHGEYDSLPDHSQKAIAERNPIDEDLPDHGCGHNLFGIDGVPTPSAI